MSKEEENALSEDFVKDIEQIISQITDQKQKASMELYNALDFEIYEVAEKKGYKVSDVKIALNRLYKNGRLFYGQTAKHLWFAIKH